MAAVMAVAMLSVQLFSAAPVNKASAEGDTADLRIMFTTDLHGQVVDVDYSKGTLFPKGGLSKAATLINQAKSEVPDGNTLLTFVDVTASAGIEKALRERNDALIAADRL